MSTDTDIDLSREALRLIAHCSATGHFVADSRAAVVASVPLRNLVQAMEPAVEAGECGSGGRNGAATAQTQASQYQRSHAPQKSHAGPEIESARTGLDISLGPTSGKPVATKTNAKRAHRLPPLDLDAIPISFEPKVDGRATSQKRRTWDPLFEALAAQEISSGNLPTKRLPPEYGGAVQAAANTWNKARKDGRRIRVARTSSATVVQREV